jgi:hypothetical protein
MVLMFKKREASLLASYDPTSNEKQNLFVEVG